MRNLLKAMSLALLMTLSLTVVLAQEKEFSQTVPFEPGQRLQLKTFKGSIQITAWDRPEVAILARITPPDDEDMDYAERVVEATRVAVRKTNNGVSIRSDYSDVPSKSSWFSSTKNLAFVHYEIQAPSELELRIEDYKSDLELFELSGDFEVETYKGSLFASSLAGNLKVETYKGTARLQGLRGQLDIETYKGEVIAEAFQIDGSSRLNTYKGVIELSIPPQQGLSVVGDIGKRGNLKSDFTLEGLEEEQVRGEFRREINTGGPRLKVSTYKGDIRIKRL